jgi:hypothetical protein
MSMEPLDRQILADHLGRMMMMGTIGNRAKGNEWGAQEEHGMGSTGTPRLGGTGRGQGVGGLGAWGRGALQAQPLPADKKNYIFYSLLHKICMS